MRPNDSPLSLSNNVSLCVPFSIGLVPQPRAHINDASTPLLVVDSVGPHGPLGWGIDALVLRKARECDGTKLSFSRTISLFLLSVFVLPFDFDSASARVASVYS
jgi:hypothetical protein